MPGIGIGLPPIARGSGGFSFQTYWNTLISATVENAAPTHVVLTFPVAQTSLGASDFTIAGFTISSASWTGAVLTLVLSTPVVMFIGDLTITFVKTGETATVINNTDDGNTVGWYMAGDGSATYMTRDVSNKISSLKDLSGNNNHLLQGGATSLMPTYGSNRIYFDAGDFLQTGDFGYARPEILYLVFMPLDTASRTLFDGLLNSRGQLAVRADIVPNNYFMYAGDIANTGIPFATINQKSLAIALFNATASLFRLNGTSSGTLNTGTGNMRGITLGAQHDTAFKWYGYIYEIIARNATDDLATRTAIEKYLNDKYSVFF